jgi:hypothetical protein
VAYFKLESLHLLTEAKERLIVIPSAGIRAKGFPNRSEATIALGKPQYFMKLYGCILQDSKQ